MCSRIFNEKSILQNKTFNVKNQGDQTVFITLSGVNMRGISNDKVPVQFTQSREVQNSSLDNFCTKNRGNRMGYKRANGGLVMMKTRID